MPRCPRPGGCGWPVVSLMMGGRCGGPRNGSRSRIPWRPGGQPGTGRPPRPAMAGRPSRAPVQSPPDAPQAEAADRGAAGVAATVPGPDRLPPRLAPVERLPGPGPVRVPAAVAPGPGHRRAGPPLRTRTPRRAGPYRHQETRALSLTRKGRTAALVGGAFIPRISLADQTTRPGGVRCCTMPLMSTSGVGAGRPTRYRNGTGR